MKKNIITNKITPCCSLPFSVMYWWLENIQLNSETDREFLFSKLNQSGSLSKEAWIVLINSGILESDSSMTKMQFLDIINCKGQPNCQELKLIIEGFKVGNYNPNNELPENLQNIVTEIFDIGIIKDKFSGNNINYKEVTMWFDGSYMDDARLDPIFYIKNDNKYYLRQFTQIEFEWFGDFKNQNGDCTDALNLAIIWASRLGKPLNVPFSKYRVSCKNSITEEPARLNVKDAIRFQSNVVIKFNSSEFWMDGSDLEWYRIFNCTNVDNVVFDSLKIIGDRDTHIGTSGEWGYGFAFTNCTNITFDSITTLACWGDGIYFGNLFYNEAENISRSIENIKGRLCHSERSRRNGVAITMGKNILIDTIIAKNIQGTSPEAGVDFECEYDGVLPVIYENIVINNIYTDNCTQDGVCLAMFKFSDHLDSKFDITINNISDIGSYRAMSSYNSKSPANGVINIKNLDAKFNGSSGVYFSNKSVNSEFINIENLNITEWGKKGQDNASLHAIHFASGEAMDSSQLFGNVQIKNINLKDITTQHNVVTKALAGRNSKFLVLDFWRVNGCWNGLTTAETTGIIFVDNNDQLNFS